eukprot:m.285473 g.285473  ORF g.285473 m.285473 type:complete len:78 (-) comp16341_c0_seq11:697-930(-)
MSICPPLTVGTVKLAASSTSAKIPATRNACNKWSFASSDTKVPYYDICGGNSNMPTGAKHKCMLTGQQRSIYLLSVG